MKTVKERIIEMVREEFGLEDGVKFNMSDDVRGVKKPSNYNPYKFIDGRLYDVDGARDSDIITEYHYIEVIKEPLLTDEEEEYLRFGIKYADYEVNTVTWSGENIQFNRGTMLKDTLPNTWLDFKGLEIYKAYTLEELGL